MAKTGVFDGDPTATMASRAAAAAELKKELRMLVRAIVEERDQNDDELGVDEAIDRAVKALRDLKSLKMSQKRGAGVSVGGCPGEFICPLSKYLMRDPVVVSTGQVCCDSSFEIYC